MKKLPLFLLATLTVSLASAQSIWQPQTYATGATTPTLAAGDWSNPNNWVGGSVPASNSAILFNTFSSLGGGVTTGTIDTTLSSGYIANGIVLSSPGAPVTIGGNTLTIGAGGVTVSSPASTDGTSLIFNNTVDLGANQTWSATTYDKIIANGVVLLVLAISPSPMVAEL